MLPIQVRGAERVGHGADFRDLLIALSDADARFMVVGGYAIAVHGHPRGTKELDVWVEPSLDNAHRVLISSRPGYERSRSS